MEPLGEWAQIAPWKSRQVLLVAITGAVKESSNGVVGKRRILTDATDATLIIAMWSGEWSTAAREFNVGDREAVLVELT